jgi:hypothetical protein
MKPFLLAVIAVGAFGLAVSGTAHSPAGEPRTEAKGSLTLGDKNYKFTRAIAYETTRGQKKQTVVVLSEKALDTAKLKQSLARKGTDEDFFPFDAHLKLRFDDKGSLVQSAIYADGANIIGIEDDNVKVAATIKDGAAKGTAKMEKPDTFFKKSFQFDVAFDVPVMQAGAVAPEPKVPEPKVSAPKVPEPPMLLKPNPKPQVVNLGEPAVVAEKELRFEGALTAESPKVLGKSSQIHLVKMSPSTTYIVDMESSDFDSFLRILDSNNKSLAQDDDGGNNLNARIRFKPSKEGTYQIVATHYGSDLGSYVVKVRAAKLATEPAQVAEKELRFEGKLAKDSPKVLNKPSEVHQVKMAPGKTYIIDLESTEFDPYLRILDSKNKPLAQDDDSGGNRNARIRFTPTVEDTYQIVATRFASRDGNYVLKIRILGSGQDK